MSWQIALMAGVSLLSAGIGMIQQKQQAGYMEAAAEAEAKQYEIQARQARLDAMQQEVRRMREVRWLSGANLNAEGEGVGFSETFRAVDRFNKRIAGEDVANVRLLGATKSASLDLGAQMKYMEAEYYAKQKKFTAFDAIGLGLAAAGPIAKSGLLGAGGGGAGGSSYTAGGLSPAENLAIGKVAM